VRGPVRGPVPCQISPGCHQDIAVGHWGIIWEWSRVPRWIQCRPKSAGGWTARILMGEMPQPIRSLWWTFQSIVAVGVYSQDGCAGLHQQILVVMMDMVAIPWP
jgi:hypothetical protein